VKDEDTNKKMGILEAEKEHYAARAVEAALAESNKERDAALAEANKERDAALAEAYKEKEAALTEANKEKEAEVENNTRNTVIGLLRMGKMTPEEIATVLNKDLAYVQAIAAEFH